jgi:hypothetical protein
LRNFLRDEVENLSVNLEEVQVDGRDAILPREDGGYHIVRDQPQLDKVEPQPATVLALIIERFTEMLRADEILPNENFA